MTRLSRVTLRPLNSDDVDSFMVWASDPTVVQPLFWDVYVSWQKAAEFLVSIVEKHPWFMAICVGGKVVGAITLDKGVGRSACRAELGYVLEKSSWGNGFASEAAKLALLRGFDDLGVNRIEAYVDPDNVASIRVLEKAGMVREACLNDYVMHRGLVRPRFLYAKCKNKLT